MYHCGKSSLCSEKSNSSCFLSCIKTIDRDGLGNHPNSTHVFILAIILSNFKSERTSWTAQMMEEKRFIFQLQRMQLFFLELIDSKRSMALPDSSFICVWRLPRLCVVQACVCAGTRVKIKHYFVSKPVLLFLLSQNSCQCNSRMMLDTMRLRCLSEHMRCFAHSEEKALRRHRKRQRPLPLRKNTHLIPIMSLKPLSDLWPLTLDLERRAFCVLLGEATCNDHTSLFLITDVNVDPYVYPYTLTFSQTPRHAIG